MRVAKVAAATIGVVSSPFTEVLIKDSATVEVRRSLRILSRYVSYGQEAVLTASTAKEPLKVFLLLISSFGRGSALLTIAATASPWC